VKSRLILFILLSTSVYAENYLLNGGQKSKIEYKMVQEIVPASGTKKLMISYVKPQSFYSPTYDQQIRNYRVRFSINPDKTEKWTDARGNEVIKVTWKKPEELITGIITFIAYNSTKLDYIHTTAPFPVQSLPQKTRVFLQPTKQVPAADKQLKRLAELLTVSSETQFDAVQQILTWIVDHINYVQCPRRYDASYSIETGKGNCQNYSHLAATLMRAVNIPVRIVNGVTLKQPYHMKTSRGHWTMRMAQGRHSWIEVYFPDLGWVPFDPQQMQLFVSNRFIRVEVGLDNEETVADGIILWTQSRGSRALPSFHESISVDFNSDNVNLFCEKQPYGPRKMLLSPPVQSSFSRIVFEESPAPPVLIPSGDLSSLVYQDSVMLGNLEFPKNITFLESQAPIRDIGDGTLMMEKNFLVETSEYVTTDGRKYAQIFELDAPVLLEKIGLALHHFGGDGQLWIELLKDDGDGNPSLVTATSTFLSIKDIPACAGYNWVDFPFSSSDLYLAPGRYWIALGYTGSPIVSWFFTYGKPVGPVRGTRYNTLFDETWSHHLAYEFNYRVVGLKGM